MDAIVAFETFYKESYARFFYEAYHFIPDREICRDIVSDCFEYVWMNYRNDGEKTWNSGMYALVRNHCIDWLRRQEVHNRYEGAVLATETDIADTPEEEEDNIRRIRAVIQLLSPKTRRILTARYVEQKKYKEVADELGISVSAVKKHIIGALKTFRAKMGKNSPGG